MYWAGGSNLGSAEQSYTDAIQSWYDEISAYNFNTGQSNGGVTGHFTQLVWKDSGRIGCGVKLTCSNMFGGMQNSAVVCRCVPTGIGLVEDPRSTANERGTKKPNDNPTANGGPDDDPIMVTPMTLSMMTSVHDPKETARSLTFSSCVADLAPGNYNNNYLSQVGNLISAGACGSTLSSLSAHASAAAHSNRTGSKGAIGKHESRDALYPHPIFEADAI